MGDQRLVTILLESVELRTANDWHSFRYKVFVFKIRPSACPKGGLQLAWVVAKVVAGEGTKLVQEVILFVFLLFHPWHQVLRPASNRCFWELYLLVYMLEHASRYLESTVTLVTRLPFDCRQRLSYKLDSSYWSCSFRHLGHINWRIVILNWFQLTLTLRNWNSVIDTWVFGGTWGTINPVKVSVADNFQSWSCYAFGYWAWHLEIAVFVSDKFFIWFQIS